MIIAGVGACLSTVDSGIVFVVGVHSEVYTNSSSMDIKNLFPQKAVACNMEYEFSCHI